MPKGHNTTEGRLEGFMGEWFECIPHLVLADEVEDLLIFGLLAALSNLCRTICRNSRHKSWDLAEMMVPLENI